MRKKRLLLNSATSLSFQICTIICGFILPRLILKRYGSEVNGLVNSLTQFLAVIGFLELGVGAVVQSSLYKPLAQRDENKTSEIISSTRKFFKKIAFILIIYVIFLIIFYPLIAKQEFSWIYTATLITAMSISSFAQYYFGIVDRLLLNADQYGYIQYTSQIITLILNTFVCVILISGGASIQIVKLVTSLIYLLRPVMIRIYVNKKYRINRGIKYEEEPIRQKWNGIAQHVASVVLDGTDTIVLTMFSTLQNVSIYSVYFLVVNGVKQLFLSVFAGFQSLIGELWAKQEINSLWMLFEKVEWMIHTSVTFVFTCVGILIVPFVKVYTNGIDDANYIQPVFALLLTAANAGHCLRLPYNIMILASGKYKETQSNYIIAAILNIVISVVTVCYWGLIGVAIGTLVAMLYQTVWMAFYNSKHILRWPFDNFLKQLFVDVVTVIIAFSRTNQLQLNEISYPAWIVLAVKVTIITAIITVSVNLIFYRSNMKRLIRELRIPENRRKRQ